jgi:hypothetical protein
MFSRALVLAPPSSSTAECPGDPEAWRVIVLHILSQPPSPPRHHSLLVSSSATPPFVHASILTGCQLHQADALQVNDTAALSPVEGPLAGVNHCSVRVTHARTFKPESVTLAGTDIVANYS